MLFLTASAFAQQKSSLSFQAMKVKAPFEMPDIKIPDFSKWKRLSIVDFGAVQEKAHIQENVINFKNIN